MVLIGSVFAADNRDGWAGGRRGDSGGGRMERDLQETGHAASIRRTEDGVRDTRR